jgi:prevent-host-death family protein
VSAVRGGATGCDIASHALRGRTHRGAHAWIIAHVVMDHDFIAIKMTATEAKARILALLDQVASGEEVEITKRGRVVARLVPARGPQALRGALQGVAASAVTTRSCSRPASPGRRSDDAAPRHARRSLVVRRAGAPERGGERGHRVRGGVGRRGDHLVRAGVARRERPRRDHDPASVVAGPVGRAPRDRADRSRDRGGGRRPQGRIPGRPGGSPYLRDRDRAGPTTRDEGPAAPRVPQPVW